MSAAGLVESTEERLPPSPSQPGRFILPPRWKPGESGNPAGRSKRFHEVQQAARDSSIQAIEKLALLMNCGDERVELMAATAILDRAFGKPKEQKTEDQVQFRPDLSKLSAPDLAALRRVMGALAGGGGEGDGETVTPSPAP